MNWHYLINDELLRHLEKELVNVTIHLACNVRDGYDWQGDVRPNTEVM